MAESMTNPFCRLFRPFCVNYEVIFCNIKKPPAHRQAAFLILNCFFISSRLKSKLSVLHLLWQLLLYSMLTGSPYMYSGAGCSVQLHSAKYSAAFCVAYALLYPVNFAFSLLYTDANALL